MATESTGHAAAHAHGERHHPYHLVDPSPWPFVGSIAAFLLVVGVVMWIHDMTGGLVVTLLGTLGVVYTMYVWWRDVLRESYHGEHTDVVSRGLRIGVALFIASEVAFFAAWFWAYFWGALVQPVTVEAPWPPPGIEPIPTWDIPFLNTMILLLSGCTVTWAHHELRNGNQRATFQALGVTVLLGILFLGFQIYEYFHLIHEGLTITAGIFGSTFYMATGFHGFHVFVGVVFLMVNLVRAYNNTLSPAKHVGFESAAWYWHFVDVVWLFLFVWVYWWGGARAAAAAG